MGTGFIVTSVPKICQALQHTRDNHVFGVVLVIALIFETALVVVAAVAEVVLLLVLVVLVVLVIAVAVVVVTVVVVA